MSIKRLVLAAFVICALAACKVEVVVPEGARVDTESGAYSCEASQTCLIDIADTDFDETFLVEPEPGYIAIGWKKRDNGLCGGDDTTSCRVFTTWLAGIEKADAILDADLTLYLEPVVVGLLVSPYSNLNDIKSVFPYDDSHRGLDIATNAELKPFRASAAGVISEVILVQLESTGNWQVEVVIDFSETFSMLYAFEPFTANQADGETQLANISVIPGQTVAQGEEIGLLYTAGAPGMGAHVHVSLFESGPHGGETAVCPEPYFTDATRTEILELVQLEESGAAICN